MTSCPYCSQPATTTILASPHRVCLEHAREFWTGLLGFTHGREELPLKRDAAYAPSASETGKASQQRALAIRIAGPSPARAERPVSRQAPRRPLPSSA